MSIRARLLTTLVAGLAFGLLAAPGPALSLDEAIAVPAKKASGHMKVTPAKPDACAAVAASGRCLAVPPPDRLMADHGGGYDVQGNPVDRYGNVIAVPESRGYREVFVSLDR
jgi:hypothetical protein